MKYIGVFLFAFSLVCMSFLILPSRVQAAEKPIFPINCGVPGKPDGGDKCCIDTFDELNVGEPNKNVVAEKLDDLKNWFIEQSPYVGRVFKKIRLVQNEVNTTNDAYGADPNALCGKTKNVVAADLQLDDNNKVVSCRCVEVGSTEGKSLALTSAADPLAGTHVCNSGYYDQSIPNQVAEMQKCSKCETNGGYWSAIGCISFDFGTLVSTLIIDIGLFLGSLIVLSTIIYNAIIIQLSRGDASKLQSARQNIVSAILGLILIIFSVFILKLIGYTVGGIFDFKIDSIL